MSISAPYVLRLSYFLVFHFQNSTLSTKLICDVNVWSTFWQHLLPKSCNMLLPKSCDMVLPQSNLEKGWGKRKFDLIDFHSMSYLQTGFRQQVLPKCRPNITYRFCRKSGFFKVKHQKIRRS